MSTRIYEALNGKQGNYILPFFWQHGEDEETLREYMGVIQDMGIRAVCLESRPHPDFAGPKWWEDMDVILSEARQRNMKVWILDDCHFPTGYANGAMADAKEDLQKWTVYHLMVDLAGPADLRVDVDSLLSGMGIGFPLPPDGPLSQKKELLCAVLYERQDETSDALCPGYKLVTDSLRNGLLPLSLPEGFYRLFLVYKSRNAGLANNSYINLLQGESVKILLDEVYEPHFERYQADFGTTIAGFFSDEPGFYNCIDTVFNFNAIVGKEKMPLPWSKELEELLLSDGNTCGDLVRLWYDTSADDDAAFRYRYMDAVTMLYEKNFSLQLGDWCRSHGVEYIGHILEDNNSSSRLGPSAGHYFRAMTGQDMSGIDVVTSQILPGRKNVHTTNAALNSQSDGEFYHYALAKLGASDAHLDKKKKGRAMCEIFGNYGWAEGAQTMKWLTDFMLVRGINVFVPHAFSPKDFPDPDCPPHFYAHGNNMQSSYLKYLFLYMNRVSHILSGGKSASHVGILYHGEAEWSGEAQLFQKPGRLCLECQTDYDVIPADLLACPESLAAGLTADKELELGDLSLRCLIVPYSQRLPHSLLRGLAQLSSLGFPVLFVDALPSGSSEGEDMEKERLILERNALVLPLASIKAYLKQQSLPVVTFPSGKEYKDLRAYQYAGPDYECVMLMNESIGTAIHDKVRFTSLQPALEYDAYENCLYQIMTEDDCLLLDLEPGESRIYISRLPEDEASLPKPPKQRPVKRQELHGEIRLSAAFVQEKDTNNNFRPMGSLDSLTDLSMRDEFLDFHGILGYEIDFSFHADAQSTGKEAIFLDGANEVVSLSVNGQEALVRIGSPYRFEVGPFLKDGENHLMIENITAVFPFVKDHPSINTGLHPMGLCGKIWLES